MHTLRFTIVYCWPAQLHCIYALALMLLFYLLSAFSPLATTVATAVATAATIATAITLHFYCHSCYHCSYYHCHSSVTLPSSALLCPPLPSSTTLPLLCHSLCPCYPFSTAPILLLTYKILVLKYCPLPLPKSPFVQTT